MSPVTLLKKPHNSSNGSLFALGNAGGVPLLLLGEFGQVSKSERKYKINVDNSKGEKLTFQSTGNGENSRLKGEWSFLNVGAGQSSSLFKTGSFDLAIPLNSEATSLSKSNLLTNVARILHCGDESSQGGGDLSNWKTGRVQAKLGTGNRTVYCKDVSETWHFGVIWGKNYGVTFAVKPKAILKTEAQGKIFESLKTSMDDKTGILHTKLVELLKAATGKESNWTGQAGTVNGGTGNQCQKDFSLNGSDSTGSCFLWGIKFSKSSGSDNGDNCKEGGHDFKNCSIGIIDVSRFARGKGIRKPLFALGSAGGAPPNFF